jgi:hypothetical protein
MASLFKRPKSVNACRLIPGMDEEQTAWTPFGEVEQPPPLGPL